MRSHHRPQVIWSKVWHTSLIFKLLSSNNLNWFYCIHFQTYNISYKNTYIGKNVVTTLNLHNLTTKHECLIFLSTYITTYLSLTDGDAAHPCAVQGSFCAWTGPVRDDDTLNVVSHCLGPCICLTVHKQNRKFKSNGLFNIWHDSWLHAYYLLLCAGCEQYILFYIITLFFAGLCCHRQGTTCEEIYWLLFEGHLTLVTGLHRPIL